MQQGFGFNVDWQISGAMFPQAPPALGEALRLCAEQGSITPLDEVRNCAGELDGGTNVAGVYTVLNQMLKDEGMQPTQIAEDFMMRGTSIPNPWGMLEHRYTVTSEIEELQRDIHGGAAIADQSQRRERRATPIPVVYGGFSIPRREYEASMGNIGGGIDVTRTRSLMKQFKYHFEDVVAGVGSVFTDEGNDLTGFLNYTGRLPGSTVDGSAKNTQTRGTDWADADADADFATVRRDIDAATTTLRRENVDGPFVVYVPLECKSMLNEDWKADSSLNVRQRLLQDIGVQDVRIVDRMPNDKYIVTSLDNQNAEYLDGMAPTPIVYMSMDGMTVFVRIMAIYSFVIYQSYEGKTGYVEIGA